MTDPATNGAVVAADPAVVAAPAAKTAAADPAAPPTLAELMTQGQTALDSYAPLAKVVADDNTALQAAQAKLQADTTSQATALAAVQAIGHQIVAAVQAQYLITS